MASLIATRIVPSARPSEATPRQVSRQFRRLIAEGAKIRPAGEARRDPMVLLSRGYTPRYQVELFDTRYFLAAVRQNDDIRFFVAYVVQGSKGGDVSIYPRIFYKDVSLVWRSASHFIRSEDENWIGKGAVRTFVQDGQEMVSSAEETTDLPLEIQTSLEELCRETRHVKTDEVAVRLVLRRAPNARIAPYRDFTEPRRRASADRRNLINGGRSIARFTRKNDPTSLRFAPGFAPDFDEGIVEVSGSNSKLYGGRLKRFRILSENRKVQYLFFAGPRHVWIGHPQATTTEIMSYGVRTIDVMADEDLLIPGYEYHFMDDSQDPPELYSQIPQGFAGPANEHDASRADASPWLDLLPVVREFRAQVLGKRGARRAARS